MKKNIVVMIVFLVIATGSLGRNQQRTRKLDDSYIKTQWVGKKEEYKLYYSHLQEKPYFKLFDYDHFMKNLIPHALITYRNSNQTIHGAVLSQLIEHLVKEINQGKKQFDDFLILKSRDFRFRDRTGVLIAKFKKFPFVVKLFVETPLSFSEPLDKGFEPICFFMMGGGVNRHLSGFTRIKNQQYIQIEIQKNDQWKNIVDLPRKWFWLPSEVQWIKITGYNIGTQFIQTTQIPGTYAVICDYIDIERTFSLKNTQDRMRALSLSNYLKQNIDPHINNYVIENKTGKIVIIDTEHFPTMVGFENPPTCTNYLQWYVNLSLKMLKDTLGLTKRERKILQNKRYTPGVPI